MRIIRSEEVLDSFVKEAYKSNVDGRLISAIVVEGYDGVGKGRVLDILSSIFDVTPYRPDYNMWQKYDIRKIDRWKISGFFWDIYSHFRKKDSDSIMLFDRGVISGAVYNHDISIAEDYKKILRNNRVLHILVTCDRDSYIRFQKARNPNVSEFDLGFRWSEYCRYTEEYIKALDISGVEYVIYDNRCIASLEEDSKLYCIGCGHYSYGICRHPDKNCEVFPYQKRCSLSYDTETQDKEESNGTEMQCVCSE